MFKLVPLTIPSRVFIPHSPGMTPGLPLTILRDDAPEVEFKDGKAAFTALPPLSQGQIASQETRILIYQEFPSLGRLLRNVSFAPTSRHLF